MKKDVSGPFAIVIVVVVVAVIAAAGWWYMNREAKPVKAQDYSGTTTANGKANGAVRPAVD